MRHRKLQGLLAKVVAAALLLNGLVFPVPISHAADVFLQNGSGFLQGGFQEGGYDGQASQPTPYNWVRESAFAGPVSNGIRSFVRLPANKYSNREHFIAVGRDDTIYLVAGVELFALIEGRPDRIRRFKLDDPLLSAPVIGADGTLYVGSKGKVFALDAGKLAAGLYDETVKWTFASGNANERFLNPPAIRGDGTIYAPSDKGVLYAINPVDGSQKWKFDGVSGMPMLTPVIDKFDSNGYEWIYVIENNPSSQADLYVLQDNGNSVQVIGDLHLDESVSTPAISDLEFVILPSNKGNLYMVDPGQFKYDPHLTVSDLVYGWSPDGTALSTPAIGSNGFIYLTSFGKLYEFNPAALESSDPALRKLDLLFDANSASSSALLTQDANGSLYFAVQNEKLRKLTNNGSNWSEAWGFSGEIGNIDLQNVDFHFISSPAIDSKGNLWIAGDYGEDYPGIFLVSLGPDATGPFLAPGLNLYYETAAMVHNDEIILLFNEELDPAFMPAPADFTVTDHGKPLAVESISLSNNGYADKLGDPNSALVLKLKDEVQNGRQVSVSYTAGTGLKDLSGNPAPSFANVEAFDLTAPDITGASANQDQISLTFDEEIMFVFDSGQLPTDGNLAVLVNGAEADIQNIAAAGTKLAIRLANPVKETDQVKFSYHSKGLTIDNLSSEPNLIRDNNVHEYFGDFYGGNPAEPISEYTVPIEPRNAGGGGSSGDGGSSGSEQTSPKNEENRSISIVIDGKESSINLDEIDGKDGEWRIEITDDGPRVEILIPLDVIEKWRNAYPDGLIHIKTPRAVYILPLEAVKAEDLLKVPAETEKDGEKYYVKVTIAIVAGDERQAVARTAGRQGAEIVGDPMSFLVEIVKDDESIIWAPIGELITDGSRQGELRSFTGYIRRSIYSTEILKSDKMVAVYYDAIRKEFYPVPTRIVQTDDGRTEVQFERPGNSIYTIVRHEKTFADIAQHWAKEDIHLLANKLIVKGRAEERFDPNSPITRAEFAALLVRALGLQGLRTEQPVSYHDVQEADWYYRDLQTAVRFGLVKGYEDQTFRPTEIITRQEMIMMMNRSFAFIGEEDSESDADGILATFSDSDQIASSARQDIASMVDKGIIYGVGENQLAPNHPATRAEAVAIIRRFLSYADFMD